LAHIVSDSICMSSYKAAIQGTDHKRVPKDVDQNPVIIGHEFCGEILKVGKKWQNKFKPGQKFTVQPALNQKMIPMQHQVILSNISAEVQPILLYLMRLWKWAVFCHMKVKPFSTAPWLNPCPV
jgi:hypothetical protein